MICLPVKHRIPGFTPDDKMSAAAPLPGHKEKKPEIPYDTEDMHLDHMLGTSTVLRSEISDGTK